MRESADLKRIARGALQHRWGKAFLAGILATLIGGGVANAAGTIMQVDLPRSDLFSLTQEHYMVVSLLLALLFLWRTTVSVVGGPGRLGYALFNLHMIDGGKPAIRDIFSGFSHFGKGFLMQLLVELYISLWSLLFVVPGIIKTYSYAMTPYILAENPDMGVHDAIQESRRIMIGNKWRLFCLRWSFFGWYLLQALPIIILVAHMVVLQQFNFMALLVCNLVSAVMNLFLVPYTEAAWAAFYREITEGL